MKVLWFEPIGQPSRYNKDVNFGGSWEDSLERIIRSVPSVELFIAFVSDTYDEVKVIDGVTYIPILLKLSKYVKKSCKYWQKYSDIFLPKALNIVKQYQPDVIQVFGTEWPIGQIAKYTETPVVAHIQGAMIPYCNAKYPPGVSVYDEVLNTRFNPKRLLGLYIRTKNDKVRKELERDTWHAVSYYMGRTKWDYALANVLHPDCHYYHVEEAIRSEFLDYVPKEKQILHKLRLVTIGYHLLKGPDMMLKTAHILKNMGVDFEWIVVGPADLNIINFIESKVGLKYSDCKIRFVGRQNASNLKAILEDATIYVHCAYIENSPNSICEAQIMGLPVVSTDVGGISTLVRDEIDGILVPANDPWQMAFAISELNKDRVNAISMGRMGRETVLLRHNDERIKKQLILAYRNMIDM